MSSVCIIFGKKLYVIMETETEIYILYLLKIVCDMKNECDDDMSRSREVCETASKFNGMI